MGGAGSFCRRLVGRQTVGAIYVVSDLFVHVIYLDIVSYLGLGQKVASSVHCADFPVAVT